MIPSFVPRLKDKTGGCEACPIHKRAVCAYCEKDELALLDQVKSYKSFEAGETILWAGDEMRFVGSIVTGVASMSQSLGDGRRQMVGLLLPSDFIGRPGRDTAIFDVEAKTDVILCRFERKPFEKLLANMPHLSERMLEMSLDELDSAREWMLVLGRKTAREKIASFLAILARRQSELQKTTLDNGIEFEVQLTRDAIADYLGLTLETVSRQINALKKEGVIILSGKRNICVKDIAQLMAETGDDTDGGMVI